jgi:hypothetical protein
MYAGANMGHPSTAVRKRNPVPYGLKPYPSKELAHTLVFNLKVNKGERCV